MCQVSVVSTCRLDPQPARGRTLACDGTTSPFRAADVESPAGDADLSETRFDGTCHGVAKWHAGHCGRSQRPAHRRPADESGPPDTLFQEIDMHRRPSYGIGGGAMAQDIRYLILSRLNLQPRQADATRTVTQEVLGTRLKQADEMSRLALEANLEQLKGKKFVYKLGELGDVVEFTGYDKRPGAVPVSREDLSGFMVADVLDEDGWKEMTHLSFLEPDKHIAPGQPWTRQFVHDWGQVGSWSGVTTYTQDSAVGSNPRFRYTHNLTYKPPSFNGVRPASFQHWRSGFPSVGGLRMVPLQPHRSARDGGSRDFSRERRLWLGIVGRRRKN